MKLPDALLFDCDGTIAETERDGHRVAFNEAFRLRGLQVEWDVERYGELLEIGGGKERMRHHFEQVGWPQSSSREGLIAELHQTKTDRFMALFREGGLTGRPGVTRLVEEALGAGVPVGVCSTSNEKSVLAVLESVLGPDRVKRLAGVFAGDAVSRKKPAPDVYQLAAQKLGLRPSHTVVIEDSNIGLRSAKSAGMLCVVTPSVYSSKEDFSTADLVVTDLQAGDVTLEAIIGLVTFQQPRR